MKQNLRAYLARPIASALALGTAAVALAACSSSDTLSSRVDPKYGVSASPRVVDFGEAVPRGGGVYRVGKPYVVAGRTYIPEENPHYRAEGLASWYGDAFHGRRTANGEVFDMTSITAAHPTLPLPSYVRVTNLANRRSLIVRVNDRGPYHGNRIIDVSNRAARLLEFHGHGVARVRVEYVGRASIDGSDDRQLVATLRTGEPAPSPSTVRVASIRPFVPDMTASTASLAGAAEVPVPAARPYTLGQGDNAEDAKPATTLRAARIVQRSVGATSGRSVMAVESTAVEVETYRQPAAAFSAPPAGAATGPFSGRGLY